MDIERECIVTIDESEWTQFSSLPGVFRGEIAMERFSKLLRLDLFSVRIVIWSQSFIKFIHSVGGVEKHPVLHNTKNKNPLESII